MQNKAANKRSRRFLCSSACLYANQSGGTPLHGKTRPFQCPADHFYKNKAGPCQSRRCKKRTTKAACPSVSATPKGHREKDAATARISGQQGSACKPGSASCKSKARGKGSTDCERIENHTACISACGSRAQNSHPADRDCCGQRIRIPWEYFCVFDTTPAGCPDWRTTDFDAGVIFLHGSGGRNDLTAGHESAQHGVL